MQVLAWMWCVIFSMGMGSIYVFGVTAIAHAIIIAGIFITATTFYTARVAPPSLMNWRWQGRQKRNRDGYLAV